jgi:hypothetical protein
MRKTVALVAVTILAACSKPVRVPTEAEFEANPAMLADWMQKCTNGEYSDLSIEESSKMCGSVQSASASLAAKANAKASSELFDANIIRKK